MKVTVDRIKFAEAFGVVSMGGSIKSPREILQNVKIVADSSQLRLTATDMETGVIAELKDCVTIEQGGSALLPIARVGSMLRESTDETITITAHDNIVLLEGSRSKFRIPSSNPDEFPAVESFDDSEYYETGCVAIGTALQRTVFACDTESSRYALGGVKIESDENKLIFVGTDGRRLCLMRIGGESIGGHQFHGSVIVPQRAVKLIQKAVSEADGSVRIRSSSNSITVETDVATVFTRLVEGRYPSWENVIPSVDEYKSIEIPAGVLQAAVRQASIVTDNESRGVQLTFDNGSLSVEASASEIGESKVDIVIAYDDHEVTVMVDFRYLIDVCRVIPASDVLTFYFADNARPVLLTSDDGYHGVIMPMSNR